MRTIPVCVALGSAALMGACAQGDQSVHDTAATAPVHAAYKDRLARDYADLSLYESRRMYDRLAAERFAAKAMAASRHQPVFPEDPARWNIEDETRLAALRQARQRLVGAMHTGAAASAPAALARAQVQYDCWVEQQAEGWQHWHIAACRDGFMAAMARVDEATPRSGSAAAAIRPAIDPLPRSLLVPFAFDSTAINERAASVMDEAAETIRENDAGGILVIGYADRAGSGDYNRALSLERAEAVKQALIERGIPVETIVVRAEGESRPIIPTRDGVAHPDNRVVQIRIEDRPAG